MNTLRIQPCLPLPWTHAAGDVLYVEEGPAIFGQEHGAFENWVRQRVRGVHHLFASR